MPIFRVKSVKIYTGKKNLHGYIRGIRDKYEVCAWVRYVLFKKGDEVMLLKEMHSCKKEMLLKLGFPSRVCSFDPIQGGAASFDPGSLYSDQQK